MRLSIDDGKEKKNLAAPFQAEVVKFKDLTPKKKMEYIWDYHKWKIITITCTIILLCVIIPQIVNNLKPTSLYVMMINSPWESEDADAMLEDFAATEGIDTGKNKLLADTSTYLARNETNTFNMQSAQKIAALLANETIDIMISDPENHSAYCENNVYYDLTEILDPAFLEQYADRLVYVKSGDSDTEKPYGIDITGLPALAGAYSENQQVVCGIVVTSKNPENAKAFISYLFDSAN